MKDHSMKAVCLALFFILMSVLAVGCGGGGGGGGDGGGSGFLTLDCPNGFNLGTVPECVEARDEAEC